MTSSTITLVPLGKHQRETFIGELQAALSVAVIEESGKQKGEIIPREEVAQSLDQPGAEAFQLTPDRKAVGGAVVTADRAAGRCSLELLYLRQSCHNRGLAAWQATEARYPEAAVWDTVTPYFKKRKIHFYVKKCGFKIVEFFHSHHRDPSVSETDGIGKGNYFRFEKQLPRRQFPE